MVLGQRAHNLGMVDDEGWVLTLGLNQLSNLQWGMVVRTF